MLSKVDVNTLFEAKGLTLEHMYSKVCECLGGEKKQDLYIDFGSGAELIDSVMRDPYSKRVTFFYYFGEDRRSITLYEDDEPTFRYNSVFGMYSLVGVTRKNVTKDKESFTRKYPELGQVSRDPWVVKQKAPINNDSFGKNFLEEVDLELKKLGSQARVRIGDDSYHFVKASVNTEANRMTVYLSSNLGRAQAFVFPMSMKWTFDKKFAAWVPDYVEDVIFIQQDIITELDMTCGDVTYWVSGIQMKYMDSAMVGILKRAVFQFMNKHGEVETFCSTSDTRLRVLKMGDETQLHLESAKKMKFD